jgi:2-phospho-L-lactate/phosphoenolpyruvate guanylyltransferase
MPDVTADRDQWSVLIPVKRLDIAKTRIAVAAPSRARLALAMAIDTVSAVLACATIAEVVIITSDALARAQLSALGARVVDDVPDRGLNPALDYGASIAAATQIAALSSDLPALRSDDLEAALHLAADHRSAVVADASGRGTTMLTARTRLDFSPAFGVQSLAAHVSGGAVDISADTAPSVRHDVDTLAALQVAVDLGVGAETSRVLSERANGPSEWQ